ncbi:hypothetical protein DXB27_19350 [Parabacteroides gordonii]|jgi:hypothetical protein|uniref:Uncharacterized protein n=2 Tax=Parabacteroides gordonii TaxID=574930 RepID=A0A0F5JFX1_9BACT|nr:hypothetical protein [Parabacteroides gordonii]KKB56649.1 hypothetical protein HMPREF1536_02285 [Parabacteroides gordonii MS-1 = DSM 23371]RGP13096.1 hypothetical protein DXB27_19350 [Parabacteroides gordonii]
MVVGSASYIINNLPVVYANIYGNTSVGGICGYMNLTNTSGVTLIINGTNTCKIVITSSSCTGGAIGSLHVKTNKDDVGQLKISGITRLTGSITASSNVDGFGGIVGMREEPGYEIQTPIVPLPYNNLYFGFR